MPLPLKDQLCFTLYATSLEVNRTYKPMLDAMGLTYPQYLVLTALGEADGMSVGAIAARLGLESSTVTPPIKRMEQAGLVIRRRAEADERQVQVFLTEAGRYTLRESDCLNQSLLRQSGLSMEDVQALNRQLQSLHAALVAAPDQAKEGADKTEPPAPTQPED
ncbi:MAG TPA: MarR family transcriptional regulator [Acidisoma sp.]|jgi:DNA-binding MarR family transcriptional regulator|uniref:MarR family winged helix-turn-helix transcriptional regulator n=1 Tax=Acidisoma sp. TaxID=1872115 RepID=UPI002B8FD588|nr:MarR family transcriptional regulator [Acidisoma sp.]HTI01156.1 MarR family transcriptional regulator [Acidisoma sp.]